MKPVAVILGSAFQDSMPKEFDLKPIEIRTQWGRQSLFRVCNQRNPAYIIFRHGFPHQLLPNQINYRGQARALKEIDCGALMVTSSVGLLDSGLPLFKPILLSDLMMPDNRLPDGSTCTMFPEASSDHGHLVLTGGLFSADLNQQIRRLAGDLIHATKQPVVFAYASGPRTKTPAENKLWHLLGAGVNSMTLAPEVILANELEIPCAGLVVGHKYSRPGIDNPDNPESMSATLQSSKKAMLTVISRFLQEGSPVAFGNQIYRFSDA